MTPAAVAIGAGAACGLAGVRPQKVALGPLVGAAVGAVATRRQQPLSTATTAATAVVASLPTKYACQAATDTGI